MLHEIRASRRNLIIGAVAVLVLIAAAVLASRLFTRVATASPDSRFTTEYALTLSDYSGNKVHLYDYARKVLIAYAWASWCPYCASELQDLGQLKTTYGDQIQIVAINRGESLQVAEDFTKNIPDTNGIVFLLDPNDSFFKDIGGYAMPEMVFIDGGGNITYHQRGPIQIQDVKTKIDGLLHQ